MSLRPFEKLRELLGIAIGLGLVAGLLEAIQHWVFRYNPGILTLQKVPAQVFWISPLVYMLLFAVIGLGCFLLSGVLARFRLSTDGLCFFLFGFMAAYPQVRLTGKIHRIGVWVFAIGAAVLFLRLARQKPAFTRCLQRMAWASVPLLLVIGISNHFYRQYEGRQVRATRPVSSEKRPNFLVFVLDTVRADHLSTYGYVRQTSPEIDRWAKRGVVFESAWSTSSWTVPAHASLLTGLRNYQHRAGRRGGVRDSLTLLPEVLRNHGYRSAGFMANDLWLSPEYGFSQGFEDFRVYTVWNVAARTFYGNKLYLFLTEKLKFENLPVRRRAEHVNREIESWLDAESKATPFFALVNYFDAHDPYLPPPEFRAKFGQAHTSSGPEEVRLRPDIVDPYDEMIAYLDVELGKLLARLEEKGWLENTVVMILSDHGESLGNHSQVQHGDSLYREVGRVPLIVFGPGIEAGLRTRDVVSLRRIPATIAELALDRSSAQVFPGPSFAPQLRGQQGKPEDNWALLELSRVGGAPTMKSLVHDRWHYIWHMDSGREEIFDMDADPVESRNLAGAPEIAEVREKMRSRLQQIFPELPVPNHGK